MYQGIIFDLDGVIRHWGDEHLRAAESRYQVPRELILRATFGCRAFQDALVGRLPAEDWHAAARQTLADPDWFRKIRLGLGGEIRRCEFTNYCEGLDQHHKQVTCKLWDRKWTAGAPDVRLANDGKRRLTAPAWQPPRDAA